MKVRFDWQVIDDDDQWETIAQEALDDQLSRLRKAPRWVWYMVLIVVTACSLAGILVVRQRYREAQRRVSFQIQSVIDLEARAFANVVHARDRAADGAAERASDLFLAQQDGTLRQWYAQQEQRVQPDCGLVPPDQAFQQDPCAPVLPAKVTRVELQGNIAWVEVIEDEPPVRRARFYQQTEQGWLHTAPRESFWGAEAELRSGPFVARYYERDELYVRPLVEAVLEIPDQVCGVFECLTPSSLEVDFTIDAGASDTGASDARDASSEQRPREGDRLSLSSPWLSGISVDGGTPDAQLDRLKGWTTYTIAAQAVRASSEQDLNGFEKALLYEYASWYSSQDISQAPLLGRIIERHGIEALPEVLHSAHESQTLTALMAQWLSLSVNDEQLEYFQTLLNIEREALFVGRRETFMLLQHPVYPWWIDDQFQLFERWRQSDQKTDSPTIRVHRVERIDRRARVALEDPSRLPEGYPPAAKNVVYFEYVDGDWKHASPFAAAIFWAFQVERRPAGTVTPSLTPMPGPNS